MSGDLEPALSALSYRHCDDRYAAQNVKLQLSFVDVFNSIYLLVFFFFIRGLSLLTREAEYGEKPTKLKKLKMKNSPPTSCERTYSKLINNFFFFAVQ